LGANHKSSNEVFAMDAITFTVTPRGTDQTITIDVTALLVRFEQVPDQRKRRGIRYPLAMLLTVAVLAKLCGSSQVHAIADWAHERRAELQTVFCLKRPTMPHPTTWTRVLGSGVAAEAIAAAVQPMLAPPASAEVPQRASRQLAVDGKTMRGTIPAGSSHGVHLVSVYDVHQQVVLAQMRVAAKANELSAAPALLRALPLHGVLVTGDAIYAQRQLSVQIVEAGGDYCWIVKENQKTLYDDLRLLFGPQPEELPGTSPLPDDFVSVRTVDLAHGRLDERVLTTSSLLADYQGWPYLAQAFQVVRTSVKGRRCTREVRYGITSAPHTARTAAELLGAVRGHWQIENGLHYRRDVTLDEDASLARMGHAPQVIATLNTIVCGVTARAGVTNLAALQRSLAAAVDRWLFRL
jgi:predicted transposase YbfD/YdcC